MAMSAWEKSLYQLIRRTSADLPEDVARALQGAVARETPGSNAATAIQMMIDNAELARQQCGPICQDTGTVLFWVQAPASLITQSEFRTEAEAAVVRATADGILRQNCVDSLTGKNTGNNLGEGSPVIHWEETDCETVRVSLILKGGGCENVGAQYALPQTSLGASRDLEGVRRCLLHAVNAAQGKGCAPGILGVCIGGDRATGFDESKHQLLREIGTRSLVPELAELEQRVLSEANQLGIGPMGFGGKTTLLDVFVGTRSRLPASYFVSVSYMCWAYRRRRVTLGSAGHTAMGL